MPEVPSVTGGNCLKVSARGYDTGAMGLDALLPPPLSRAHRDAQAEDARAIRERVDAFLVTLDDELLPPIRAKRTRRPAD